MNNRIHVAAVSYRPRSGVITRVVLSVEIVRAVCLDRTCVHAWCMRGACVCMRVHMCACVCVRDWTQILEPCCAHQFHFVSSRKRTTWTHAVARHDLVVEYKSHVPWLSSDLGWFSSSQLTRWAPGCSRGFILRSFVFHSRPGVCMSCLIRYKDIRLISQELEEIVANRKSS